MHFVEGIIIALEALWTNKLRTILTLLGNIVGVMSVIAVVRTALEDRTLQEELPGYRDYARRVRYRLFPGIY